MARAGDLIQVNPFLAVLLYGPTGTGKTTFGARSPRPFVALTEDHALSTIVRWNEDVDVEYIRDWNDLVNLMVSLKKGAPTTIKVDPESGDLFTEYDEVQVDEEGEPVVIPCDEQPAFKFTFRGTERVAQTLVLDSLSDVQDMAKKDIGGEIEDMTQKNWGIIYRYFRSLVHDLRTLPINKVVLCASSETQDEQGFRRVRPTLDGRIKDRIGQWFHAVGFTRRREGDNGLDFQVCWQLGSNYDTKGGPGFPSISIMDAEEVGRTSLGSLLLAQAESIYAGEVAVPHMPCDSADFVDHSVTTLAPPTKGVATRRRRKSA